VTHERKPRWPHRYLTDEFHQIRNGEYPAINLKRMQR